MNSLSAFERIRALLRNVLFAAFACALAVDATPRDVRVAWSGAREAKKVALTFDDGPAAENTEKVLDLLRAAGARATFFLVGRRIESSGESGRALLKRMIAEGHEIGNHSYNHDNAARLSAAALKIDIEKTQRLIESACGMKPVLYRPPGGGIDFSVVRSLASTDIEAVVLWSMDTSDWTRPGAAHIQRYVEKNLESGSIILMHDTGQDSIRALPVIIDLLQARGYELVTVSELLR